jgi:hypothetical protein
MKKLKLLIEKLEGKSSVLEEGDRRLQQILRV